MQKKHVHIYTDGSCLGNPGPGGYGAILVFGKHRKSLSQGYILTTNNRMELLAPAVALEALTSSCSVTVTTDSQYVKNGINQWIHNWKKNGWRTKDKKAVKNADLWKRLDEACERHSIDWQWVKGHSGHPENEACDELARNAAQGTTLIEDLGYQG